MKYEWQAILRRVQLQQCAMGVGHARNRLMTGWTENASEKNRLQPIITFYAGRKQYWTLNVGQYFAENYQKWHVSFLVYMIRRLKKLGFSCYGIISAIFTSVLIFFKRLNLPFLSCCVYLVILYEGDRTLRHRLASLFLSLFVCIWFTIVDSPIFTWRWSIQFPKCCVIFSLMRWATVTCIEKIY
jgi:hypothetical protein